MRIAMSAEREPYAILRDDGSIEVFPPSDAIPAKPDGYQGRQIHATKGPHQGENLGVVYSRDALTPAQYHLIETALEREATRRRA
jgi:hypothetical protein